MVRVIVVDDDPFVCVSLQTILGAQEDIEVVAVGGSGSEAIVLYDAHVPDVLLMDIQMAGGDGLSAAEQIIAAHPDARVVFLTTFADDDYIVRALHLGAKGYLIKQNVTDIAPAVRAVATEHLALPMRGRAESLNAAVAAGIMMYALMKDAD